MSCGPLMGFAQADSLEDTLIAAYQSNPQLMAERARLRESDETYVQAAAQGRFTASSTASLAVRATQFNFLAGTNGGVIEGSESFVPRSFAVTGQVPLYQGGRVRSLKGQAEYGILTAREVLRDAEQNVLLSAATAYVQVLRDEEIARIRRNDVSILTRQSEAAQERFNVGAGTRTDVAQADARIAASKSGLAAADAALATSRAAFVRAAGFIPSQLEPVAGYDLPDSLEAAQLMALTYNPQLEAARYAIDAAKFGIDVAKSANRPSFNLQTFAQFDRQFSAQLPSQDSVGLTANLTIPLLTGGLNGSQLRSAEAARSRALFEMRAAEQAVTEQITVLWAQKEAAHRTLEASHSQVSAAEIAFEGVQIERDVGTRTALDVLDAEQELLEARLSVSQAQSSLDIVNFQILAVVGAFDALSLKLPAQLYDPESNFKAVKDYKIRDDLGRIVTEIKEITHLD